MVIYIILFIVLNLLLFMAHKHGITKFSALAMGLLFIISAFRSETVGTDTSTYITMFKTNIFDVDIEFGFKILVELISNFSKDSALFIFLVSIIQYYFLFLFIKKNSKDPVFSIVIFLTFGFFFFYLSGLRQSIATSFFLMSLHFFYTSKNFFKATIFAILAVLFHTTVIVFIPLVILFNLIQFRSKIVYTILFASLLIAFGGIFDFQNMLKVFGLYDRLEGAGVLDRYKGYGDFKEDIKLSSLGFIRTSAIPTCVYIWIYFHSKYKNQLFLKLYFVGVVLSNLLISFPIGYRFALYFMILQIIVIPNLLLEKKVSYQVYIAFIMYGLLVYLNAIYAAYEGISNYRNDIVPYEFF